nr:phospho-sugar mutase [Treponemataceae bacterium]
GGKTVLKIRDVQESVTYDPADSSNKTAITLPKSNVLQFFLDGGTVVSARPSGTEPKIKFYINSKVAIKGSLDEAKKEADILCDAIKNEIDAILEA